MDTLRAGVEDAFNRREWLRMQQAQLQVQLVQNKDLCAVERVQGRSKTQNIWSRTLCNHMGGRYVEVVVGTTEVAYGLIAFNVVWHPVVESRQHLTVPAESIAPHSRQIFIHVLNVQFSQFGGGTSSSGINDLFRKHGVGLFQQKRRETEIVSTSRCAV